ncbi:MAG: divergent polysaccharide deacetylase family protein [Deltaproteobacteria bacterium]|nr:divergent polysaccharide deacetylase family protein [Deltaproteobacteria bacterium]
MAKKKKGSSLSWLLLALGFAAGVGAALFFFMYISAPRQTAPPVKPPETAVRQPEAPLPVTPPEAPEPEPVPETIVKPPVRPRLAIIIDDMGPDIRKLKELLEVGGQVTIAVMPNMRDSGKISNLANSKGLDVIVHMPMEPRELMEHNPGDGALLIAMSPEEIRARMESGMKTVPDAIGMNNHMGSRFTEDAGGMREVLKVVKKKDMLFIDSRTTSKSVAGRLARELGVPSADRNVFLDNTRDVEYIKRQLMEAVRQAQKNGRAIAIGHPYPETIRALRESVPALAARGIDVVGVSEVVGPSR